MIVYFDVTKSQKDNYLQESADFVLKIQKIGIFFVADYSSLDLDHIDLCGVLASITHTNKAKFHELSTRLGNSNKLRVLTIRYT